MSEHPFDPQGRVTHFNGYVVAQGFLGCDNGRYWQFRPEEVPNLFQATTTQGMFANGTKIGVAAAQQPGAAELVDRVLTAAQKDGSYQLKVINTAGALNQILGPSAFGPIAGQKLRTYCKFKNADVDKNALAFGLATDPAIAVAGTPATGAPHGILDATGAPGAATYDAILFHRLHSTAVNQIILSVWDGATNAASTQTLTLSGNILDDTFIEMGFAVNGLTSINYWIRANPTVSPTVGTINRVAGSVLDLLGTALQPMGPVLSYRCSDTGADGTVIAPGRSWWVTQR